MSKTKFSKLLIFLLISSLFVIIAVSYPYDVISILSSSSYITRDELDKLNQDKLFYSTEVTHVVADDGNSNFDEYVIKYKLFNLFNITNLKVNVLHDDEIFAGGNCLGFNIESKGVAIVGSNYILSKDGAINPFENSGLKLGDIITKIDDVEITSSVDIQNYLNNFNGGNVTLTIVRGNQVMSMEYTPILDVQSDTYKMGLWLKSDASGVGTLTFVNQTTGRYGSLGHAITNASNQVFEVSGGNIYEANVIGVKKGLVGSPGEIIGVFNTSNPQGDIDKNTNFGVFGDVDKSNTLNIDKLPVEIGGRLSVKPGKAQILSTIDGYNIETFDIDIIKTNFQNTEQEKSMVVRITDQRLLDKTGGIVQGMSGSPIIQDGKLVGAITHVFVNDPTKGFGVYIDWMLEK